MEESLDSLCPLALHARFQTLTDERQGPSFARADQLIFHNGYDGSYH